MLQHLIPPLVRRAAAEGDTARIATMRLDATTPPARGDPDAIRRILRDILSIAAGPAVTRWSTQVRLVGRRGRVSVVVIGRGVRRWRDVDAHGAMLALAAARATAETLGGRLTSRVLRPTRIELVLHLPIEPDEG
jgi:hypothetical protein